MTDQCTDPATLAVKNVTIARGADCVLTDASFSLTRGDVLGLVGRNGAGKSTTLASIAGMHAPAQGAILVEGHDVVADPISAKRHIGFLSDPPALFSELTVQQHLDAIAMLYGFRRPSRRDTVESAIAQTRLHEVRKTRIGQLSEGFKQRVGIAQAILHKPALLLLDEPTNGLDIEQQAAFAELIGDLAQETAVILSSHHLSDIRACCNQTAVLDAGRLRIQSHRIAAATTTVFVQLRQPVTAAELFTLPSVVEARAADAGWLVSLHGDIGDFSAQLSDRDWGLLQLSPPPTPLPSGAQPSSFTAHTAPKQTEPAA
ncbi:MAG: ABC transporter ATP-binding protein [Pseudomonadota bacterium]